MSGISIGRPHINSRLGGRTFQRCRNNFNNNNEESNNIILIDVETENFDNIVVIDVPESLPKEPQHSSTYRKDKKLSFKNVINIDDDDNDDINTNAGVAKNFPEIPVRLSKCKRTYSGKASRRNRFGLDSSSGSDSADDNNDYLDCELMEDVSGEVQELWEKAFSRRRKEFQNNHSDIRDHDSTSRVVDLDYCKEAVFGFSSAVSNNGKDGSSCSRTKRETELGSSKDSFETKNLPEREHLESDEIGPFSRKSSFSKSFLGTVLRDTTLNEAKLQKDASGSNIIQPKDDKDGQVHRENGGASASVETCMISEREKLKETDEYKRAMEEEWTSRQQALQIQAEEAKHLRRLLKRRKAESMRLLDMEKRQKLRIEEVRDIQRKDEENMNLKESIRVEIRKELKRVETLCHSMSSLLHLLGISVGGWPSPLPQEVQTAYKRALLTFHPDRASQSDIRQQVEAEEKFKLINRLKEKFSPS